MPRLREAATLRQPVHDAGRKQQSQIISRLFDNDCRRFLKENYVVRKYHTIHQ